MKRIDTLFLRLFLLMWFTLVISHMVAFMTVVPFVNDMRRPGEPGLRAWPDTDGRRPPGAGFGLGPGPGPDGGPPRFARMPALPSLPPGNPFFPGDATERALPRNALWLDYGIRMLLIALGAAVGARWLSTPVRRLTAAAAALGVGLSRGMTLKPLQARRGTVEVRDAARVFNQMASQLQQQFDARGLHMAALSHDLRTPLARLRLRLEQIPGGAPEAAIADIVEMDEMIGATLAVLREQRDGAVPPVIDLVALLQAITDDRAEQGDDIGLQESAPVNVRAHSAALKRIIGNLVDNGLRHGGGVRIGVTSDGVNASLTVDDDGPGIAPADIERAFKPWVRLSNTNVAGAPAGHGLGLSIARDLAERNGGSLTLENRAEGGLRARLTLPNG